MKYDLTKILLKYMENNFKNSFFSMTQSPTIKEKK